MPKLIIGGVDYGAYPTDAGDISYDNTSSGLSATKVQGAIDELSQSSGASSVAQLEDVQLNNLSDNDLLVYDSNLTGGKLWKNAKKIVTCTRAQFDAWSANNSFPYTDCKYIVTDVNNLNTTAADIPYDSSSPTVSVKDKLDNKADIEKLSSFNLTCPRCSISSVGSAKVTQIGNIIYLSANLTFGSTSSTGGIYFTSGLVTQNDYCFGSLFDDLGDIAYQIVKGNTTSIWVKDGATTPQASTFVSKSRMYLNLVIVKTS